MRTLLLLLALVVLVVAGLFFTGLLSLEQTRPGVVQAPSFHADVGRVSVGTRNETVQVPTVNIERADGAAANTQAQ